MSSGRFSFEIDGRNDLSWSVPMDAPEVTDDQARTLALLRLANAIDGLTEAVKLASPPRHTSDDMP